MKVLWVVNTVFPDVCRDLKIPVTFAGGWMYGLSKDLAAKEIELTVATSRTFFKSDYKNTIDGISYVVFRGYKGNTRYDKDIEPKWAGLVEQLQPDVIHIHGTEFSMAMPLIRIKPNENYVISIQGLIIPYSRFYFGGIKIPKLLRFASIRDIIRRETPIQAYYKFKNKGNRIERSYFTEISNYIGRTTWDYAHAKALNPGSNYYFCNESLRPLFYSSTKWDYQKCIPFQVFVSQSHYPIKGLHKVLEAVALLKEDYPDISVRIAGKNLLKSSWKGALSVSSYGLYIRHIIRKHKLNNIVSFTGPLSESEMIQSYLNSNLFICPSSIENSPNSLGEAQLLGVPTISSYVGGIPDMVEHGKSGMLYHFDDYVMLSHNIRNVFEDRNLVKSISNESIKVAELRHSRDANVNRLMKIYSDLKTGNA